MSLLSRRPGGVHGSESSAAAVALRALLDSIRVECREIVARSDVRSRAARDLDAMLTDGLLSEQMEQRILDHVHGGPT